MSEINEAQLEGLVDDFTGEPVDGIDDYEQQPEPVQEEQQPEQKQETQQSEEPEAKGFNPPVDFEAAPLELKNFQYKSTIFPKLKEQPEGQAESKEEQKQKIGQQVREYHKDLREQRLLPLEQSWAKINASPNLSAEAKQEIFDQISSEYSQIEAAIQDMVDSKRDELFEQTYDERFNSLHSQAEQARIKEQSNLNYKAVATEVGTDSATLDKLIFGDGQQPGYASDLVRVLFENSEAVNGLETTQQYNDKLVQWWNKFSSSQDNLRFVARNAILALGEQSRQSQKVAKSYQKNSNGVRGAQMNTRPPSRRPQTVNSVRSYLGIK